MMQYQLDSLGLPRDLPDGPTKEAVEEARRITGTDAQRLRVWTFASAIAMNFPRRLGPDAPPEAMAFDKKVSKKICHMYHLTWNQMYNLREAPAPPRWGDWDVAKEDARIRQAGATVIWVEKIPELIDVANGRIEKVEGLETPIKVLKRWQRRRIHLLKYEQAGLERISEMFASV
jgi:hypothetical protein